VNQRPWIPASRVAGAFRPSHRRAQEKTDAIDGETLGPRHALMCPGSEANRGVCANDRCPANPE